MLSLVSYVYVKARTSCPLACDAPVNDFMLYKRTRQYADANKAVADAALEKNLLIACSMQRC